MGDDLISIDSISNRFFIMRHGNSIANQQGLVVSDPGNGIADYGLSELGKNQVLMSIQKDVLLDADTLIFCSDFKRARQTAELVHQQLGCVHPVKCDQRLRERFFGDYELGADSIYEQVWQRDLVNPNQQHSGVESVNKVVRRAAALLGELNKNHQNEMILLVAHGDILQILQTTFAGKDASQHRSIPHLQTAEIRQLLYTHQSADSV